MGTSRTSAAAAKEQFGHITTIKRRSQTPVSKDGISVVKGVLARRDAETSVLLEVNFADVIKFPTKAEQVWKHVRGNWAATPEHLAAMKDPKRTSREVVVARSGFLLRKQEDRFVALIEGFDRDTYAQARRAGMKPAETQAEITSGTGGTIDAMRRVRAKRIGIPSLGYLIPWMINNGLVNPNEPCVSPVVLVKNDDDYSEATTEYADQLKAHTCGAWALLSDVPRFAIANKPIYLIDLPMGIDPIDASSNRIDDGNLLLIREIRSLKRAVKVENKNLGHRHLNFEQKRERIISVFEKINVTSPKQFEYLQKILDIIRKKKPDFTIADFLDLVTIAKTAEQYNEAIYQRQFPKAELTFKEALKAYQHSTSGFANSRLRIVWTGPIADNNEAGTTKMKALREMVGKINDGLVAGSGLSLNQIGAGIGWGTGCVPLVVDEIMIAGAGAIVNSFRVYPKSKLDLAYETTERKKEGLRPIAAYSDIIPAEDIQDIPAILLGEDMEHKAQVAICIEGDSEEAKGVIKKAVAMGIPVVIMKWTDLPLYGEIFSPLDFSPLTKGIANVAKWVDKAERLKVIPTFLQYINGLCSELGFNTIDTSDVSEISQAISWLKEGDMFFATGMVDAKKLKDLSALIAELEDLLDMSTTIEKAGPNKIIVKQREEDVVDAVLKITGFRDPAATIEPKVVALEALSSTP